ncbi:tubulin-specific chaperone cofactor E-like protein isoform X1 [Acipenser ruthenus]|nr:tubulin-specific chaperone cofactor E-like protein isoform X1 [Acipenser ruthenus]XP_058865528.1 tubulin-specific chaperone cofactor E-like protein isoform X1 [Acipenser ruthenus]XP_058865529.1 tubulin-specific chaperone cofactor E-like protein isoform X1 [Acipenser ruthenus]XP_058865530.1 tubulin-specific chaperone cofactor E-like protein isoform X1 [Acipenser ruthenus]XP_058865531.1 tubulin-specific chaperone cofactor E-like protein isoform X1 [Acipenser ruthenus]XP_058865532.1 tubulin-sp
MSVWLFYACGSTDGEPQWDFKMEQVGGRSFMEVLSEKYSPENFPYRRGPGMGIVVPAGPQGSPMKDRLNLPSILVLNSCCITSAGDEGEIAAFCAHVCELDLSDNKLEDWHEISKIVSSIPHLYFLNLTTNPLSQAVLDPSCSKALVRVRRLVLNNTKVSWETLHTLLAEMPQLEQLFLCLNGYDTVSHSSVRCSSLRLLHITDNNLQDWSEVCKVGAMFPCLDTLVMANNHLSSIGGSEETLSRLFPCLHHINLHNSGLNSWGDIEKLNLFPKLDEVRLKGIPLLQNYTNTERRNLIIARLPSVTMLNGSDVTDGEREDAERFFIRHYLDFPEEELPCRYHELVTKYGKLAPLAEVDLRPRCHAKVEVRCEGKMEIVSIRLDQTVSGLKKRLRSVVQLSPNSMRLYYIDKDLSCPFGPEEMKYSTRALHSYSIKDGDEILVVPKSRPQSTPPAPSSSSSSSTPLSPSL